MPSVQPHCTDRHTVHHDLSLQPSNRLQINSWGLRHVTWVLPCHHRVWHALAWAPKPPVSPVSVQDINISLWRLPEKVKFDRSVFMNQGEWELLGVLTQFQEFSIESSDSYAEMKFYVSGTHPGRRQEAHGEEPPRPFPKYGVPCSLNEAVGETQPCSLSFS